MIPDIKALGGKAKVFDMLQKLINNRIKAIQEKKQQKNLLFIFHHEKEHLSEKIYMVGDKEGKKTTIYVDTFDIEEVILGDLGTAERLMITAATGKNMNDLKSSVLLSIKGAIKATEFLMIRAAKETAKIYICSGTPEEPKAIIKEISLKEL